MGCSASRPITIITNKKPENHFPSATTTTSESSNSSSPNPNQNPNLTPKAFSLTTPLIHHPPLRKGDTHHLVSLTSTTYGYGSLLTPKTPPLRPPAAAAKSNNRPAPQRREPPQQQENRCSLSPDSVINTWELMHGLDDDPDFDLTNLHRPIKSQPKHSSCRYTIVDDFDYASFSSHSSSSSSSLSTTTKPLWQHLSEESLLAKMDPNVGLTYRRALSSRQLGYNKHSKTRSLGSTTSFSSNWPGPCRLQLPNAEDRVVVYFTSLRGIRKTYEDCCSVRNILRGFRVFVDERDISMDSELKKELRSALSNHNDAGTEAAAAAIRLPQVFIKGKHVGGAEEIMRLHEAGELAALLEGFPTVEAGLVCRVCGDARFVPCRQCSGSRKVFAEDEGQLRRCEECNENGLIRCPSCCCS